MNKPVDFEIAKALKEKGFDEKCSNFYTNPRCKMFGIDEHGRYYPIKNKAKTLWISGNAATLDYKHVYYAPTIAEVCMWFYDKHGIWIQPYKVSDNDDNYPCFWCEINNKGKIIELTQWFNSPTEAYEDAIEYVLKNLI